MISKLVIWRSSLSFLPLCEQQLHSVCKNMQTRVVELIPSLSEEELIGELLVINDDLNNVFIRYERYDCQMYTVLENLS